MSLLLGLRLAVAGGREALLRLAFTAVAVGVGITLLLLALTGQAAVQGRADRIGWQDAAYVASGAGERPQPPAESADSALFLAVSDYYDGAPMTRAYAAALGADPPVPPGLVRLPGPGEVAASPAMRRLLESTPDDQLRDRFPGRVTMTIGDPGLAHSNELVAIVGRTPGQLRGVGSVQEVRGFDTIPNGFAYFYFLRLMLLIGTVLLLVPVVILIVMVTRVAAARREQRLAAIRLVGATRLQTAVLAAAEAGIAAVAGSALAWAAYEAGRRLLAATVTFQGGRFFREDVTVARWILVLVLVGAPAIVTLTTIASLRRVQVSPLGISRRGSRPAPPAWHALPIVAGIGGQLALGPLRATVGSDTLDRLAPLFAVLTIVGFVLVGPWLCLLAGRGLARISRRVPGLLAARRIAADPRATFRAVSGVVLAAWVITYIGSTVDQFRPPDEAGAVRLRPGVVQVVTGGVPADQVAPLRAGPTVLARGTGGFMVSCAELSRVRYVPCPHTADSGRFEPGPGAESMAVAEVYIRTDGTLAAENRVRTRAANLVPNAIIHTDRDPDAGILFFAGIGRLASVACLFVLLVGACSLAAGMIGGLVERRRPFALLRASGLRLGELRRLVFLETAATMLGTAAVGVGLGLVTAYAAARQGDVGWRWPGLDVFGYVGGGVLAALIFSTLALPLLDATTRPDTVRYE